MLPPCLGGKHGIPSEREGWLPGTWWRGASLTACATLQRNSPSQGLVNFWHLQALASLSSLWPLSNLSQAATDSPAVDCHNEKCPQKAEVL